MGVSQAADRERSCFAEDRGHKPIHIYSMPYTSYSRRIKSCITLINVPLQMAEPLLRGQPVSVANHVIARQSLIERAVTRLATESG